MKNIDKEYQWIARDKDGSLWTFQSKPIKHCSIWLDDDGPNVHPNELSVYKHLFQFVKWENEPYNIDELLKQNGVKR